MLDSIISGIVCAGDMFSFLVTCCLEYGDCSGEDAGHLWGSFCEECGSTISSVRSVWFVSPSVSGGESSCAAGTGAVCVSAPFLDSLHAHSGEEIHEFVGLNGVAFPLRDSPLCRAALPEMAAVSGWMSSLWVAVRGRGSAKLPNQAAMRLGGSDTPLHFQLFFS